MLFFDGVDDYVEVEDFVVFSMDKELMVVLWLKFEQYLQIDGWVMVMIKIGYKSGVWEGFYLVVYGDGCF